MRASTCGEKHLSVLLVEDDPAHAKMVSVALKGAVVPTELHHVTDGNIAVDFMHGRGRYKGCSDGDRVDIILLDLRLGHVDGLEVLQSLKSDQALRSIPVIVLTTSDRQEDIDRSYSYGANAFVTKPLEFHEFVSKVRDVVEFWTTTAQTPGAPTATA